MNSSAKSVISQELRPGEALLWSGQPPAGLRLRASDVFLIPFSLMWGGFAIFWEALAIGFERRAGRIDLILVLWGIPFVLIGLYMIAGRFYVDTLIRRGTYYGITNERVIIRTTGPFSRKTRSLELRSLSEVELSERRNGGGSISFGRANLWSNFGISGWPGYGAYAVPSFEREKGARAVHEMIRTAQREAGQSH